MIKEKEVVVNTFESKSGIHHLLKEKIYLIFAGQSENQNLFIKMDYD